MKLKKTKLKEEDAPYCGVSLLPVATPISDRLKAGTLDYYSQIYEGMKTRLIDAGVDPRMAHIQASGYIQEIAGPMDRGSVRWKAAPGMTPDREPLYVIAPAAMFPTLDYIVRYEEALRSRMGREDIFVFPEGTDLSVMKKSNDAVAVVQCAHCGQWAARYCVCKHCGAPVE